MIDAKADRLETITEVLEPADYSLEDIEEVLQKIGKRHRSKGVPIPESMQETAEALRQAVRARDAAVSPQISTKPITNFDLDTTAPAAIPASAPFLSPVETSTPAPAHTPNSNPIATFESDTATPTPSPAPTTATDPASAVTMTIIMLATVEQHDTEQCEHEREDPEVQRVEEGDEG
jgi:hypothetical protein